MSRRKAKILDFLLIYTETDKDYLNENNEASPRQIYTLHGDKG